MKKQPLYQCLECGRGFHTAKSAERAMDNGCPGCGGSDIDLYVKESPQQYVDRIKTLYPSESTYIDGTESE